MKLKLTYLVSKRYFVVAQLSFEMGFEALTEAGYAPEMAHFGVT